MICPPSPPDEAARLDVIDRYGLTDPEREDIYDRIAALAADVFQVPIALVSVVGKDFQCFRGATGLEVPGTARDVAFCAFAILDDTVMVVEDATKDPRFAGNPLVTGDPHIRFYAGAPLVVGGHAVGTLCIIDSKPRSLSAPERGRLVAMAATVIDLLNARLDRILAERADRRLREIMNAMPAALVIWDENNRLADFNPAWRETFFPDLAECPQIGDSLSEIVGRVSRAGVRVFVEGEVVDWQRRLKMEVGAGGAPYELRHWDGRWFSTNHVRTRRGRTVVVISDVTNVKEREAEAAMQSTLLRATLDNVDEGIALFDTDRRLLVSNENFFKLLRTAPAPNPTGLLLCGLLQNLAQAGECVGSDADFFKAGGVERLAPGERRHAGCRTFDRRYLDFESTGCRDNMIILVCADVTEIKEVERLKDEFVSTVSHELRTPLTSISGSLDILASGAIGEFAGKAAHFLGIARTNCDRLTRLVNDLLEADKIDAGVLELDRKPLDLAALLTRAIEQNLPYAEGFNVKLELLPAREPITVRADEKRLLQVVANLLSNAIKHSPRGETVTLSSERSGDYGRFTIEDRGPGIPESFRRRVFTRFAQADSSDDRAVQGTGLGLNIARGLVQQHGGRIGFETEERKGTRFHVDIPLAESFQPGSDLPELPRVLMLLGDGAAAGPFADTLGRVGASVEVTHSPHEAKRALKADRYDCLLVDIAYSADGAWLKLIGELESESSRQTLRVVRMPPGQFERTAALSAASPDSLRGSVTGPARNLRSSEAPLASARIRILHVEDDPEQRELVEQIFSDSGTVLGAPDLATARRLLARDRFDVVILDLMLPDGNGIELLPQLMSDETPTAPVVVFSATEASTAVASSVDAALTKSKTSIEELKNVVIQLASREVAVAAEGD